MTVVVVSCDGITVVVSAAGGTTVGVMVVTDGTHMPPATGATEVAPKISEVPAVAQYGMIGETTVMDDSVLGAGATHADESCGFTIDTGGHTCALGAAAKTFAGMKIAAPLGSGTTWPLGTADTPHAAAELIGTILVPVPYGSADGVVL